VIQALRF